MGRLAPPSVVSAIVGGEHISTLGDNRVDFASFLVVLTLQVSGEVLKRIIRMRFTHRPRSRSFIGIRKNSLFIASKYYSCVKRDMAHYVYDNCSGEWDVESHSGHLLSTNHVA